MGRGKHNTMLCKTAATCSYSAALNYFSQLSSQTLSLFENFAHGECSMGTRLEQEPATFTRVLCAIETYLGIPILFILQSCI